MRSINQKATLPKWLAWLRRKLLITLLLFLFEKILFGWFSCEKKYGIGDHIGRSLVYRPVPARPFSNGLWPEIETRKGRDG